MVVTELRCRRLFGTDGTQRCEGRQQSGTQGASRDGKPCGKLSWRELHLLRRRRTATLIMIRSAEVIAVSRSSAPLGFLKQQLIRLERSNQVGYHHARGAGKPRLMSRA